MRAVLDPNILISAVLSRSGAPARLLARWLGGEFELVVSPALLDELGRALAYPKLSERIPPADAAAYAGRLTGVIAPGRGRARAATGRSGRGSGR